MDKKKNQESVILIIFGAAGDLTWRLLTPGIYNVYLDERLPENFALYGIDSKDISEKKFRNQLHAGVDKFSRRGKSKSEEWKKFESGVNYLQADFTKNETYQKISQWISELEKEWESKAIKIFYLAIPPDFIETVTSRIGKAGLARDRKNTRIVVEKPFGHDLQS
ncbi:MAG: glucose-6-phosphate dehydrogenase, partial [Anaerolineales bacterium]